MTKAELQEIHNRILGRNLETKSLNWWCNCIANNVRTVTATGNFPKETIQMMTKIALEVEKSGEIKVERRNLKDLDPNQVDDVNRYAIAQAVETFSRLQHIENIVAFSCSGKRWFSAGLLNLIRE